MEQPRTIGAAIGRSLTFAEISSEEFRATMSRFMPADIITMLLDYWSDTATVPDVVHPTERITGTPGRTPARWAADHAPDFGPAASRPAGTAPLTGH